MAKTILVTVADDRFGRKDGKYSQTQDKIFNIVSRNPQLGIDDVISWKWDDIIDTEFYENNKTLLNNTDAARNGRAYKPFVIMNTLLNAEEGDYIIYSDSSPEMWKALDSEIRLGDKYNVEVIKELCRLNNDILTAFVKWDVSKGEMSNNGLGIHTHANYTTDRCIEKMGLSFYKDSFMHASGMWCIRNTKETRNFVERWLYWNCIDECASLGWAHIHNDDSFWKDEEQYKKMGHRHDQSISGLLLSEMNWKFVDIKHNELHPYNFLQFCVVGENYEFIPALPVIGIGSVVENKQGTEMTIWRIENSQYIVGAIEESCYATSRENLRLIQ